MLFFHARSWAQRCMASTHLCPLPCSDPGLVDYSAVTVRLKSDPRLTQAQAEFVTAKPWQLAESLTQLPETVARTTHTPLLFRTGEERTLRLHASLPATRWPRHACTLPDQVSAERVVQPFFVPYKNAGLRFPLSLWSCVRFTVCLGMIFDT